MRHKRLLYRLVVALIFICPFVACADVTTYTYDDANQTVTEESRGGNPTIVAIAGPGGSISPSGVFGIEFGSSMSFTITANPNCVIVASDTTGKSGVPVDGAYEQIGASATSFSKSFGNIVENHTITAQFNCPVTKP
jgi:hypothetical protein